MNDRSKRIAGLSAEGINLLAQRLMSKNKPLTQSPKILRRDDTHIARASFAQERMWFLNQLEPGSPAFNTPSAIRLTGLLNLEAFRQSLNEVVRRHEALRTTFEAIDGQPHQIIAESLTVEMPVVDLESITDTNLVRRSVIEETNRPFDLASGPLLRVVLLRLRARQHIIVFTMHHIISDGWSMGVMIQEVVALYEAFCQGAPSALSELPIQYADYSQWHREWIQGDGLKDQLSYWKQQLSGGLNPLDLPTDHARPLVQTFQGALHRFDVSESVTSSLKVFSQQESATLFMTSLAAFTVLLQRYTGQDDIAVGTNNANRNRRDIEKLIGFFVNNLILRIDLSADPTFRQLVGQVRETALEAYSHQDVPYEMIVAAVRADREISNAPLLQVMFFLQNIPSPQIGHPDFTLSPFDLDHVVSKFDLAVSVKEEDGGMRGWIEYSTELFDHSSICRLAQEYMVLLENVLLHPDESVKNLTVSREEIGTDLIQSFNAALD
ncbi:MAG: condensation domain-containing protein [Blastocatellia bacterium]